MHLADGFIQSRDANYQLIITWSTFSFD